MSVDGCHPSMPGLRVLLLDDAERTRRMLAELLEEISCVESVVQAEDVRAVLLALDVHPFDLAILDLHVPGHEKVHNGIDVAGVIKTRYPQTRVAVLTALADPMDRRASLAAGADEFFDKGELERLLSWVTAWDSGR